jgi:SAM-dependent methyltransferase|tara:strand:+ start:1026 stop:1781 length:756 start_codon:yes stop_codon:yes gene_type:complete
MSYTLDELKETDARIPDLAGWDFSRMKTERDPVPWDYGQLLRRLIGDNDRVLDQGTGGGEVLLHVAPICREITGIDLDQHMIDQANRNLTASDRTNVTFICMDSDAMDFADEEFDVAINRHSGFIPKETSRVIKPGGYFITQQVGSRNCESVFAGFEWSQSFPDDWSISLRDQGAQFEESGMRIVGLAEYSVNWWIKDVESLVFWLRSVPTPAPFDLEIHWQGINVLCDTILDDRGFRTHEHRELLIAQKS